MVKWEGESGRDHLKWFITRTFAMFAKTILLKFNMKSNGVISWYIAMGGSLMYAIVKTINRHDYLWRWRARPNVKLLVSSHLWQRCWLFVFVQFGFIKFIVAFGRTQKKTLWTIFLCHKNEHVSPKEVSILHIFGRINFNEAIFNG